MKLVDIWNSKLQTQGECTSTRVGESKEELLLPAIFVQIFRICTNKVFWILGQNGGTSVQRLQAVLEQRVLRIRILYSMSLPASCILLAIHWFLIPLIKTAWRVSKFSNSMVQMSEFVWKNCVRRSYLDKRGQQCFLIPSKNWSCLKLVTNYYTAMLTKFRTGVGSAIFILKLQDHLRGT